MLRCGMNGLKRFKRFKRLSRGSRWRRLISRRRGRAQAMTGNLGLLLLGRHIRRMRKRLAVRVTPQCQVDQIVVVVDPDVLDGLRAALPRLRVICFNLVPPQGSRWPVVRHRASPRWRQERRGRRTHGERRLICLLPRPHYLGLLALRRR